MSKPYKTAPESCNKPSGVFVWYFWRYPVKEGLEKYPEIRYTETSIWRTD